MRLPLTFVCLLSLVACGDDDFLPVFDGGGHDTGPEEDAGNDAGNDAGPPDDVGFDAGPLEDSYFYGPCQADSQCPGANAFCRLPEGGYTDGQCTVTCADRGPCDDGDVISWCLPADDVPGMACEYRCRNTVDCRRDNYVCIDVDQIEPNGAPGGRCIGWCGSDEHCTGNTECNEQAARCVPAGTTPTEGAVTGEACENDSDCISGDCVLAVEDGVVTGEVNGICRSLCRIPAGFQNSNFYLGDTLPTTHCPNPGDICLPVRGTSAESEGTCYTPCDFDGQCRDGRRCLRTISGHTFTNGVCIPIDCSDGTACPAGHVCSPVAGRCMPE